MKAQELRRNAVPFPSSHAPRHFLSAVPPISGCGSPHIKRSASLVAMAMAMTGLLSACGSSDSDQPTAASSTDTSQQAPAAPVISQLNNLTGPTREVTVEFQQGTNMAASPSPDGSRIAFTAQGALWIIPAAGGSATRITGWEIEPTAPVWSPDGKLIAFQNYTPQGNYHLYTIEPNGANLKEVTTGFFDDREPAWTPDGSSLVFASDRSGDGQYKIWRVAVAGGTPVQITKGPGAESNPVVSPDGTQVAYTDTNRVFRAAYSGNDAATLVGPGAFPAWMPNGQGLVFQTGTRALNMDGREVTSGEDLFPFPVRWLPDGRFLYTADGKIRIRDSAGGNMRDVPFSASITVKRPNFTKTKDRHFDDVAQRQIMGISAPALSPDGRRIAFVALNDVWVMTIGEAPVRLTNDKDRDGSPQWTADGSAVYFSSEKGNAGALAVDQVEVASGRRTRLASIAAKSMVTPKMSPSGDRIAFTSGSGQLEVWNIAARSAQVIAPSISTQVSTPYWTPDGSRIMLVDNERINNRFREGYNKLRVIDVGSREAKFYPVAQPPQQISERDEGAAALSPDGKTVAFIMDSVLHVMPLNADGSPAGAARKLTDEVADLPSWSGDSSTILYKSAGKLKTIPAGGGSATEVPVNLQWRQAVPQGTTIVHAGAVWDGVSPQLRQNVDIVITGNRITEIRPHQDNAQASAERFIDASTLTVMPGLWDAHIHPLTLYQGGQYGQIAALMLAYGITSTQSVAGPLHQSVEMREALEAGNLNGPRLFISPPLWEGNRLFYNFARTLRTPEIADMEIAKAKAMDTDYMKSYVRAPIPIMTRIAQAGLDLGVPTGTHMLSPGAAAGLGGTTHLSATQRMGYGWSKSVGGFTYQDAVDMHAKTDFRLVDTLFSSMALVGEDPTLLTGERFSLLVPPNFISGLLGTAQPTAAQVATVRKDAEQSSKILAAGGLLAYGTDSPLVAPGIALHMNLRGAGLVLNNHQALQTVTINAAKMSMVDKDLGTIEAGKLADLVMVRGNPLVDLKTAANVEYVMKNGFNYSVGQILEPFKTPAAIAARKKSLMAYRIMCAKNHHECGHGMHAH
ncbi:amidohydrolase family protein [Noviherbaspirillum sp. CPCC 100848]|uniref:Amidohydrolase family protein n=1 Tax=Noviherbaspirillum album TaxID=3080276 RepID=A0ABU6J8P1_9BURK|nr:amidohydrolase family protein [Noviherbaspirillum sp. CPCC 100848]MEC4720023.1 amidohydrolase family protein [Noviherbaspirillum sp. CPCC 100848]